VKRTPPVARQAGSSDMPFQQPLSRQSLELDPGGEARQGRCDSGASAAGGGQPFACGTCIDQKHTTDTKWLVSQG